MADEKLNAALISSGISIGVALISYYNNRRLRSFDKIVDAIEALQELSIKHWMSSPTPTKLNESCLQIQVKVQCLASQITAYTKPCWRFYKREKLKKALSSARHEITFNFEDRNLLGLDSRHQKLEEIKDKLESVRNLL